MFISIFLLAIFSTFGHGQAIQDCGGDLSLLCQTDPECATFGAGTPCGGPAIAGFMCCQVSTTTLTTTTSTAASATTAASTTTNSTCVDRINELTGVSDCPARSYLCTDSNYISVMIVQCPRTCGYCSNTTTTTNSTCADLPNPLTGVSDCPSRSYLCSNSDYTSLMAVQCRRTCGYCSNSTTTTTNSTTCVDRTSLATGLSDCSINRALCNNTIYLPLMRIQCPATCGFCTSG